MLMVIKEAGNKTQTGMVVPPLFRTAKGKIAKQATAVNGHTPAVDSRRLFCFTADKVLKPKNA